MQKKRPYLDSIILCDHIDEQTINLNSQSNKVTENVMRSVWKREKLIMSFISFSSKKTIIGNVFY